MLHTFKSDLVQYQIDCFTAQRKVCWTSSDIASPTPPPSYDEKSIVTHVYHHLRSPSHQTFPATERHWTSSVGFSIWRNTNSVKKNPLWSPDFSVFNMGRGPFIICFSLPRSWNIWVSSLICQKGKRKKEEEEINTMFIDTSEIWTAWWKYVHLLPSNSQVEIFLNPRNQIIC